MPAGKEHVQKAEYNEQCAVFIAELTPYVDWAVVVLYYAAVHYVDAVLAISASHPPTHAHRHAQIQRNATLQKIYREYRLLEAVSRNARYSALPVGKSDWEKLKPEFDVLRAHLRNRMGLPV